MAVVANPVSISNNPRPSRHQPRLSIIGLIYAPWLPRTGAGFAGRLRRSSAVRRFRRAAGDEIDQMCIDRSPRRATQP